MISTNKNTILTILIISSILFTLECECSELLKKKENKPKAFAPRFLINVGTDLILTLGLLGDERIATRDKLISVFLLNSVTPVILFQNYHSLKPFLITIASTGSAVAATELIAKRMESGYGVLGLRLLNYTIIIPTIGSVVNYVIHLNKFKKDQLNLNLLQPTSFVYDNKIVPAIQLIELNW